MTEHWHTQTWQTQASKRLCVYVSGWVPLMCLVSVGCQAPWFGAQQTRNEQTSLDLLQAPPSPVNKNQSDRTANRRHGALAGSQQDSLSQPSESSRKPAVQIASVEAVDENAQEFSLDDLDPNAKRTLQSQWKAAASKKQAGDTDQNDARVTIEPATSRKSKSPPNVRPEDDEDQPVSISFSDEDEQLQTPGSAPKTKIEVDDEAPERIKKSQSHQGPLSNWKYAPKNRQPAANIESPDVSSRKNVHTVENVKRISDTTYRESGVQLASAESPARAPKGNSNTLAEDDLPSHYSKQLEEKARERDSSALLREALESISVQSHENVDASSDHKLRAEIHKRLLHLMLGELDEAMESIETLQTHEQDFFKHLFQTLHDVGDPAGNPVRSRRNTLALASLRKSLTHLAAASNLEVHNATFCSKVDGFGVLEKFPQYHFRPEQEVLLYCELDNFVSDQVTDGFETKLQGSYEIVNADGRRVADQTLPMDAHVCRNQRRDYFIAYRLYMPRSIDLGKHSLRLTIEDLKGQKYGQTSLEFHIVK